jgi:pantoate--beta-alanine ligase
MAAQLDRAELDVEYAVLVDPETLEPAGVLEGRARALIAARIGTTRLIDNAEISAHAERPTPEEDE